MPHEKYFKQVFKVSFSKLRLGGNFPFAKIVDVMVKIIVIVIAIGFVIDFEIFILVVPH